MSAAILLTPGKLNTVHDDMESVFWLLLYHILRYMKHDRLRNLKNTMEFIFDEEQPATPDTSARGGNGKRSVLVYQEYVGSNFTVEGNKPLTTLINDLLAYWGEWYQDLTANSTKVIVTMRVKLISKEEAAKLHPFDPQNLAMYTYDISLKAFEKALAMTDWPTDDKAVDHLPKKRARKLEAIVDHPEDKDPAKANSEETQRAASASRPVKKLRTSQRLKDEAEYRPSSATSAIPINLRSRESMRNKELPPDFYLESESDVENKQNSDSN